MKNIMEIDGHKAVISFDPDIGMFRGEFLGLSGGADFMPPTYRVCWMKAVGLSRSTCRHVGSVGSPLLSATPENSMSGFLRICMRTLSQPPRHPE